MPTTLRIALLAGLLALLSNLAVIGFIYERTHDEAVASLHRQVVEQSKVLTDVYRTGGKTALNEAIDDTLAYADPQTAVALISRDSGELKGNVATSPPVQSMQEGYHSAVIRLRGQPSPHLAEIVLSRLASGEWLVSGRLVGEGLAFRATLERSLILALAVAGLLGLLCGVILAHYVSRRIGQ
ncbi:MAG TPA: hypothetical protein VGQ34_11025, partial [Sphingomicrobium sp.]|nr:hypothetical protein [Sphingomicrobium sp.]